MTAIIGGIAGLIEPSTFRFGQQETPSRRRIAAISFAVFIVSLVGGGIAAPKPTPEERARPEQAAKAEAEAERKEKEQAAQAKAKKQKTRENEISALWSKIVDAEKDCSRRADIVSKLNWNDHYAAYRPVQEAREACRKSYWAMQKVKPSKSLSRSERDAFDEAIEVCADANLVPNVLCSILTVLNGDMRPSAVQGIRDAGELAQATVAQCVVSFLKAAEGAGVSVEQVILK
ncbi:hypothetical protein U8326_09850 [Tsuneonella sp. CC-YZS046]|uniref:hypothetical protein n=1 Tax=Tsuneonella sp. CC-YZS046 TaxID=3042152 RepID=UPI002D7A2F56|nr:hypothetical protein [Tsuneonella sp. CC-YZS046]WRO65366.1 hypothetical protein U8326_09850 [Tsuneonella sp. CC-YZS046]